MDCRAIFSVLPTEDVCIYIYKYLTNKYRFLLKIYLERESFVGFSTSGIYLV